MHFKGGLGGAEIFKRGTEKILTPLHVVDSPLFQVARRLLDKNLDPESKATARWRINCFNVYSPQEIDLSFKKKLDLSFHEKRRVSVYYSA